MEEDNGERIKVSDDVVSEKLLYSERRASLPYKHWGIFFQPNAVPLGINPSPPNEANATLPLSTEPTLLS